jgi:ABC-type transport system involved in cytochrome bd biosynthesis fused ATPase/permease subunit
VVQFLTGASVIDQSVAYVPQQPWILNDTIRSNIFFENTFDEKRYNETVTTCALDHDTKIVIISGPRFSPRNYQVEFLF